MDMSSFSMLFVGYVKVVCETVQAMCVAIFHHLQFLGISDSDFANPSSGHVRPGSVKGWGLRRFSSGGYRFSLL